MDEMSELTAEDYESLEHASKVLHERGELDVSFDQMMNIWKWLVTHIESEYDEMVDEYTNDLGSRDWLAAAWPLLTDHVREGFQKELDALDSRFLAATEEDTRGALRYYYHVERQEGWWWRRIPIHRSGYLADQLSLRGMKPLEGERIDDPPRWPDGSPYLQT
jgi:hypothetical protein